MLSPILFFFCFSQGEARSAPPRLAAAELALGLLLVLRLTFDQLCERKIIKIRAVIARLPCMEHFIKLHRSKKGR